jgi:hypothetical protein
VGLDLKPNFLLLISSDLLLISSDLLLNSRGDLKPNFFTTDFAGFGVDFWGCSVFYY